MPETYLSPRLVEYLNRATFVLCGIWIPFLERQELRFLGFNQGFYLSFVMDVFCYLVLQSICNKESDKFN